MPPGGPRKDACRNFQRGSCSYGSRCKFLHATPLQQPNNSNNNNPFGFGKQQQQQQQNTNPFGFGTQPPNQSKPFENKWSRFSSTSNGGSQASKQPANQPIAINHKCTDPDACKRLIIEDFEHEKPLWKLTCYGHNKSAPCDIIGDVSYEELRAAAYNDASNGLSLQSIVERERGLLNAKLQEFESLLRNPYVIKSSSLTPQSSFTGFGPSPLPVTTPNITPPSVSSFTQLGGSLNTGFRIRPDNLQKNAFGQQTPIQFPSQTQSGFGTNKLPFGFGVQNPSTAPSFNGFGVFPQIAQSPMVLNGPNSVFPTVGSKPRENEAGDKTIWDKEWKRGAVPEEAPPDEYISWKD